MPRWLGIDYGTVRIGLALSDPGEMIASPVGSLQAGRTAALSVEAVLGWCRERGVGGFVVGLPLHMDGAESEQARRTRIFEATLRASTTLPVEFQDERLSSFAADRVLDAAEVKGRRRTELRDALAAQQFLQAFLDHRRRRGPAAPMDGQSGS